MTREQLDFSTYCIGVLSMHLNRSQRDIFNILKESGVLMDYIVPGYVVLHTFPRKYLAEDISMVLKEKGVLL